MFELNKILREEYEKKKSQVNAQTLIEMIEEMIEGMTGVSGLFEKQLTEGADKSSPGVERRERALRLPTQFPTEISVGQTPGDPDREIFELWMSKIAPEGDLGDKVQALQNYVDNPPKMGVADTLSYLMFLNTFAFVLQEFNASVAGFLWEPFLAGLFGATSVQVPTSEHDIADVKLLIQTEGGLQRVSLKILREKGSTGGSFKDLVDHFARNPQQPMIYVVIKKLEGDSKMKFFQFPISQQTLFDFIGHPKLDTKYIEADSIPYTPAEGIAVGDAKKAVNRETPHGWRTTKITSKDNDTALSRVSLMPDTEYVAHQERPIKVAGTAGAGARLSGNARKLWGAKEYAQWYDLWEQLEQGGIAPVEFWNAVAGKRPDLAPWAPDGAPGYGNRGSPEQFEIAWNILTGSDKVELLGILDISKEALDGAFAAGAQTIGADLTDLFNSMSTLVENVSKFFLIDCGDPMAEARKCDEKDAQRRGESGREAIDDANTVQRVVVEKIGSQVKDERDTGLAPDWSALRDKKAAE